MNKNIAVGVITYKPGQNLVARLTAALAAGYRIYLFDNSPEDPAISKFAAENPDGVKYLTGGTNAGLGYALAALCSCAYDEGVRALLFFDQDTVFTPLTLDFVDAFNAQHPGLDKAYSSVVFNAKGTPMAERDGLALNDVPLAVNSGSLYFLENLKRLGWHNKTYFVDCVDYEFCLNTYSHGLKVGEYTRTPGFDHSSEQADSLYNFFGTLRPMRAYAPGRIWDSVRATLRLLGTALMTGNLAFFRIIGMATAKYLVIQFYVRAAWFTRQ